MPPAVVWMDGLVLSSIYILIASGLVLVFSIMGIVNFAHGQLYMLGAFLIYYMFARAGINYFVSLVITAVAIGVLGVAIERGLLRPLAPKGLLPPVVVTLGLIFLFEGIATLFFGPEKKAVPSAVPGVSSIGALTVSNEKLVVVAIAFAVMVGLYFLVSHTKMGLAMRASAEDPYTATLYGVSRGRILTLTMFIGCALAGIAASLMAPLYYVDPWIGLTPLIMALLAIVIGGLGSVLGAVVGGALLGFSGTFLIYYLGPWSELAAFVIVIAVLLLRPEGIFGRPKA